jgi:hypothetical protein
MMNITPICLLLVLGHTQHEGRRTRNTIVATTVARRAKHDTRLHTDTTRIQTHIDIDPRPAADEKLPGHWQHVQFDPEFDPEAHRIFDPCAPARY